MKVKQNPADFQVEELTDATTEPRGEFAFYRLHKVGWTTHDALEIIRQRWQIESRRVNYGGLKDRHADTVQYLTIHNGPKRGFDHQRMTLSYLGQRYDPYSSRDIRANRFGITLRALKPRDELFALNAIQQIQATGIANYFDDQRFGSVTTNGPFIAKHMVLGEFEAALKIALTEYYEFDRAETKHDKQTLREHWGDWPKCKGLLNKGHARSLVDYLVHHPTDFKGTCARLRPELGGLYVSAYQSDLWNRLLAKWLQAHFALDALGTIALHRGAYPIPLQRPEAMSDNVLSVELPLPTARLKPDPAAPWFPMLEAVMLEEGITLKQLKIPGLDRPFFSKGERTAFIHPQNLEAIPANDDVNPGQRKLILKFTLPRGCYATMLIKRLTAPGNSPADAAG